MKTRAIALLTTLAIQLSLPAGGHAAAIWQRYKVSAQDLFILATLPAKASMQVVSDIPIVAAKKILGRLVIYDDPTTKRPADYLELSDDEGVIVAIVWFDRFGIERMVVDQALLEEKEQLEGVLVPVLTGVAI